MPDDDNSECIQCSILNCGESKGTKDNIYCNKCKSEYFIPNDSINKKNCEKCSLENCKECQGQKNDNICTLCIYDFYEKKDVNNKIESCNNCEIGEGKKYLTCSEEGKNKCASCNPSF